VRIWRVLTLTVCAAVLLTAQNRPPLIEWPHWGGDAGHTKFSAAADITAANFRDLELAWTWQTVDRPVPERNMRPGGFENTPIMIDDVVYVSTSFHRVVALDAETGAQLWVFDPRTYEEGPPLSGTGLNSRGVAFWRGGNGERRIFVAGRQRIFAVDAATGAAAASFGSGGEAALNVNVGRDVPRLHTQVTSPPVIYKDLVIVGTGVPDRLQYRGDPVGTIQAFDVRTGKRAWIFHTIPQSPTAFGADTWGNGSWKIAGHANVWAPFSLDAERGLLYIPTTTPSGDYWGGWRPGANLFAESIVCLDAATGQRKWHFQAVHHGLWDYDFASAPTLATIRADGRSIDAVAQVSKQGFVYVFDRVTGQPVWPIEERRVDTTTDVPGEQPYPTQPFPTKPPALVPQGISLEDANDLTPEIKALAEAELKRFRLGPLFTPPSLRGTVQRPSQVGASNWGGAAFDPSTGLLFVKAADNYHVSTVCKNDGQDPFVSWEYSNYCGQYGLFASRGPQGSTATPPSAPRPNRAPDTVGYSGEKLGGIPLTKPPYAFLVAVDLNRGDIAWKVPFGDGSQAIRRHPLLKGVTLPERLGTQGNPGPLVTASGLVLIGGGDPYLYAFDKMTGREIARVATPQRTSGNPMTYRTRSGRQLVVIATGAGPDAALAAFALPSGRAPTTAGVGPAGAPAASESPAAAFARVCQPCHGPEGRSGIAPPLVPMTRSSNEVLAIVREGVGQMPQISARELTDEAVRQVVDYLRSLARP
jgi:quinoprotein glucose dehydrogenase